MLAEPAEVTRRDADRFLWRPFAWWLGVVIVFSLIYAFAFAALDVVAIFLGVYLLPVLVPVGLWRAVSRTVYAVKRRQWRRALSIVAVVSLIVATPQFPGAFLRPFIVLAVKAQFAFERRALEAEVAGMPKSAKPRYRFFERGYGFVWSLYTVYDEDDQLTREPSFECANSHIHLRGHFYSCLGGTEW